MSDNIPQRVFLKLVNFCLFRNNINNRHASGTPGTGSSIVFYDHACPICRAEMLRLKARDRHARLILLDISSDDFDAQVWGIHREDAQAALHVLTPANAWLKGMPAIRHVYAQVGLGWLLAPTGWPLVSRLADFTYRHFAPNRFAVSRWLGLAYPPSSCSNASCVTPASRQAGGEHV